MATPCKDMGGIGFEVGALAAPCTYVTGIGFEGFGGSPLTGHSCSPDQTKQDRVLSYRF